MSDGESALHAKAEKLAQLLAEYALDLPSKHPLRTSTGLLSVAAFRQLIETDVGDHLQDAVFSRMVELLPPVGDSLFVDVRLWLAPHVGDDKIGDDAAAVPIRELMRIIGAACQDKKIPLQQLYRMLEGHDTRGIGEVGVASFVNVMQNVGLGDALPLNVSPIALLRRALGSLTNVPYRRWLSEYKHLLMQSSLQQGPATPRQLLRAPQQAPSMSLTSAEVGLGKDSSKDEIAPVIFPVHDEADFLLQKRDVWNVCRDIVCELVAMATTQAETNRGSRQTQNVFASRPVIHNALTSQERFSHNFSSLVSQSLVACCCSLNRLLLLEYGHILRQIDLLSGVQLNPVHIGRAVPYVNVPVISMALDDALGRLGTLDEQWSLTLWEMQRSGNALTSSPFGIDVAQRQLPRELPCVLQAMRSFRYRQYDSLGYGPHLLYFLDSPARCYCLNASWIGKLIFFDAHGLGTLRVLDLSGRPQIDARLGSQSHKISEAGVSRSGLWSICEGTTKSKEKVLVHHNLLSESLRSFGATDQECESLCSAVLDGDMCDFRQLCMEIDKVRYPVCAQPVSALVPHSGKLSREMQTHISSLLADSAVVDALYEVVAVEHRALALCTVGGMSLIWIIGLFDGAVVGSLSHFHDSVYAHNRQKTPIAKLPPVVQVVSSRDIALTGGRTIADSIVNVWNLCELPGLVPKAPSLVFNLQETVSSPIACLGFLPRCQSVVDARVDGKVYVWDMARFTQDLNDPSGQPNGALVSGDVQRSAMHEATLPGSATPALTLPKHSIGLSTTKKFPVICMSVPALPYAKYDLILALSRASPTTRYDHANGLAAQPTPAGCGPATLMCWSVVRTRIQVPAVIIDVPGLDHMVEPKVEQHASAALEQGIVDVQNTVRHRLEAALDRSTKPRTRHARCARRSTLRCSLDFSWDAPALPDKVWKDAWSSSWSSTHDEAVRCFELDTMSLFGKHIDTWRPPNSACNFVHMRWERKFRHAWMQWKLPPGKGVQGVMVRAIRRASRNSPAVVGSTCSMDMVQPQHKEGMNVAGWTGMLMPNHGSFGPGIAGIWKLVKPPEGVSPTTYQMKWNGQRWITKSIRELRRLKVLDSHGHAILLPLPMPKADTPKLNPEKDGSLAVPIGIFSVKTADAPCVYCLFREAVVLPSGILVDDFLASSNKTEAGRQSVLATPDIVAQFKRCVNDAGGSSFANVAVALAQLGMNSTTCDDFLSYLRGRLSPDPGVGALQVVADQLGRASKASTLGSMRDLIATKAGGATVVEVFDFLLRHDWRSDVHNASALERVLAKWGIPVCRSNRDDLLGMLQKIGSFEVESGKDVYSMAKILRSIYGEDEVANGIFLKNRSAPLAAMLKQLDTGANSSSSLSSSSTVSLADLQSALQQANAHRLADRLAALSVEKSRFEELSGIVATEIPPEGRAKYEYLLKALETNLATEDKVPSRVLEYISSFITQSRIVRLLALFCGGLVVPLQDATLEPSGEDWWSPHGWVALPGIRNAVRSPRLYGCEAIEANDLKVAVRSVAGLAIPEEHLFALVDFLNPENHNSVSTTRFLQKLHACRKECVERSLDKLAELAALSPRKMELLTTCAANNLMSAQAFLPQMSSTFPELEHDKWALLVEAFHATVSGQPHVVAKDLVERIQRRTPCAPPLARPGLAGEERLNLDLLTLIYGARKEIIEACERVDTPGFGTVSWDRFQAALASARVFLEPFEVQELELVVDYRHDGMIPYRRALHRIGRNIGVPSEFPHSARRAEALPASADVYDLWRVFARTIADRGLDVRSVFFSVGASASHDNMEHVSRRGFVDAFERLGITAGVLASGEEQETASLPVAPISHSGNAVTLPPSHAPSGPLASRLHTSRDLVSIAFRQLDAQSTGRAALLDIERCIARGADQLAERQRNLELEVAARIAAQARQSQLVLQNNSGDILQRSLAGGEGLYLRYLPQDLLPYLGTPPNIALATAVVLVAADLEAQQLSAFDAFACLDSSGNGVLSIDEFCPNLTTAVPAISLQQANIIFHLISSLPQEHSHGDGNVHTVGITFPQFERVFPLHTAFRLGLSEGIGSMGEMLTLENLPVGTSEKIWFDSIIDRVVQCMNAQGLSPEEAFRRIDPASIGVVGETDFVQGCMDLRFGISPGEARLFYHKMEVAPGGTSYRGFIGVLRAAYDRTNAREQRTSKMLVDSSVYDSSASEVDLIQAVGRRVHQVDPNTTRIFSRFAIGGRLPRDALRDLVHHLGLRLDRTQLWQLWQQLDPTNCGVVEERTWQAVFRTTLLADVHWNSIFTRLENSVVSKGVPLHDLLSDMDKETKGVLTPVVARKIFAKLGLAANDLEVNEWISAVTQLNPRGEQRIDITQAAAITTSRAHGGRLLAARRLQAHLRVTGISAHHALRIILRGMHSGDLNGVVLSRRDIVQGLSGLGIPNTSSDVEQLLELLDPQAADKISPDVFLRVANPDASAARKRIAERLPVSERESFLPAMPTAAQVRHALAKAGMLGEDVADNEADLLVLALTTTHEAIAQHDEWSERLVSNTRARRWRRHTRGRWLNVPSHQVALAQFTPKEPVQVALESRAESFMRRLLDLVAWDLSVLTASLPPSPPWLSLRDFNSALHPLGIHLTLEDANMLRQAFKADAVMNSDYFIDVQQFLTIARRSYLKGADAKARKENNMEGYYGRLLDKLRMRLEASGLDLVRSVFLGRPVMGSSQRHLKTCCASAQQLEETLRSHPIALPRKEASDLANVYAQHFADATGKIDIVLFVAALRSPIASKDVSPEDTHWITQIQLWMRASFADCASAFAYIDSTHQGAVDFTHFCDAIMRLMTGSLPIRNDPVRLRLLDAGNRTDVLSGAQTSNLLRQRNPSYAPDTYVGMEALDVTQRSMCASACQRLFIGLTRPPQDMRKRQLRLLMFGDFQRFWQCGIRAMTRDDAQSMVKSKSNVLDFWAAELCAMLVATNEKMSSVVAGLDTGNLPGQVSGCALIAKVVQVMVLRFAPLLQSKLRDEPLTSTKTAKLLHEKLASLHPMDLSYPLVMRLCQHAERLVHCVTRAPLHSLTPLVGSADIGMHWSLDASRFIDYCERARMGTGDTGRYCIGAPLQMKEDLAQGWFGKYSVFVNALEQAASLSVSAMTMTSSTGTHAYASLIGLRCFALRLRQLQSLLVDLQMRSMLHAADRISLTQLVALDCLPSPPEVPKASVAEDAAEALVLHLSVLQQLQLDELQIGYRDAYFEDIDRKVYEAAHVQQCWITIESIDLGRPGRVPCTVVGFARFFGQPSRVVFRLAGNADSGVRIAEILQSGPQLQLVLEQGWLLHRPEVPPAGLTILVERLQPGDTLVFRGNQLLPMIAELVPKAHVCEALITEAALGALLSGRSGEQFEQLLKPEERSVAWALSKARMSCFHGWWCRGDYALVKESLREDGWVSLLDVVKGIGGLSKWWLSGGMYFFKLLCRQILSLLLLMHKEGAVARHLRLQDFHISKDGQHLRLHSIRYASLLHSAETMLPSLQGAKAEPLAPEFFAKGASQATCKKAVDSWVFGSLAFHLYFGRPPPTYQKQAHQFYMRHSGLKWPGSASSNLENLPAHFSYSPLSGVPPAHRILARVAVDKCCSMKAPPRMEAALGPLVTALWSHSGMVPPIPVGYNKVPVKPVCMQQDQAIGSYGPEPEIEMNDSGLDVASTDPNYNDNQLLKQRDVGEHQTKTVVVPEGHLLDLVFACLVVDQKKRPTLQQLFVSTAFDVEGAENGGWHLSMLKPQLESFVKNWVQGGHVAKTSRLEHTLRVMCAYLFKRNSLTEAQQREFHLALHGIESIFLGAAGFAATSGLHYQLLHYIHFIVMRTKDHHPQLLARFSTTIALILENLSSVHANTGVDADTIIDLVLGGLCGHELPIDVPAHWQTRFFLRPLTWQPSNKTADMIDEMWRHEASELNHFGASTYAAFSNHHRYLLSCLGDSNSNLIASEKPRPLHAALKKRGVRGIVYLRVLADVSENHYKWSQGSSPVAKRLAVQHSRHLLATLDPEQWLALSDMRVPDSYIPWLGCGDESVLEEVLSFFEEIEQVLLPPGEHCHAGLDCPACSRFRPHHQPRAIQLLTGLVMSPVLELELKKSVVRILISVAMAYGLPPQRQAFASLVQVLQMQRPRSDSLTAEFQPYIRKQLLVALQTPTPALVHSLYCHPGALTLLGLARADVCQPLTLKDVADQARVWLRRTKENSRATHARPTNWIVVLQLSAWTRHLAQLDALPDLVEAMDVLSTVYQEAFIYAELPHLPQPRESGGLPPAAWENTDALSDPMQASAQSVVPMRFMVEFLGLIELLFLRLGPAPVKSSVALLVQELLDPNLVETPWHFQLLHLFGTLTAEKAPWLRAAATEDKQLQLRVFGLQPPQGSVAKDLHPSSWNLARWYKELHAMGFGTTVVRVIREALSARRILMRRPKWTGTLLTLVRVIWQNLIEVPSSEKYGKPSVDEPHADLLLHSMIDNGILNFLVGECLADSMGDTLSNVQSSLHSDDRITALLDIRAAAISLLEDLISYGRHHALVIQSLLEHISRQFVDAQRSLLFSARPTLQASAARLFRMLLNLHAPEIDVLLEQLGVASDVRHITIDDAPLAHLLGSRDVGLSSHPLALHSLQVGELIGGFKGAKPKTILFPDAGQGTKPKESVKPKTDLVVPRKRPPR